MYMIGVFCLVATAVALPVLPDPPSLPESSVSVQERRLHTNVPEVFEIVEQKVQKDENKEEKEHKVIPLPALPAPPELPPLEESIYRNLRISDEELPKKIEILRHEDDEKKPEAEDKKPEVVVEKSEDPVKEEPKVEEPKKNDDEVEIEEVKEKPLSDSLFPTITQWRIPKPGFLTNIMSSLPSFPFWPFNRPSIFGRDRPNYPTYVIVEE